MQNWKKELFKAKNAIASSIDTITPSVQNAISSIGELGKPDRGAEIQSRREAVQQRVEANQSPGPRTETPPPPHPETTHVEEIDMGAIEAQLQQERLLRERKAEQERLKAEAALAGGKSSPVPEEDPPAPEETQDALVTTVTTGVAELSEEDQPRFALYSSKSVVMKRDEGFIFCVDVNAGYFQLTVENSQRSALEALAKLGQEPTLYVRVRVLDPRPWAKMFVKNFTLRSQRDSKLDWVFSVNRSSTLQVIVVHNGALQSTGNTKTSYMAIQLMACFPSDFVSFHRNNGVKKAHEVQEAMDASDTIKPQFIEPAPEQLAQQLYTRHSFSATGVGDEVLIFGGCRPDGTFTNQLMTLDCCTNKLGEYGDLFSGKLVAGGNKFVHTGLVPSPRAGHSACTHAGKIIFFGGFDAHKEALAETHFFHIADRAWSSPDALRATPIHKDSALCTLGRGFHTTVVHESHMYVYGGCSDFDAANMQRHYHTIIPASALWRYDFQDRSWTDLTAAMSGAIPHSRGQVYGHCAAVAGDGMFVCGGAEMELYTGLQQSPHGNRGTARCEEVHYYSFTQGVWTTYRTTGIGPLLVPFAAMWSFNTEEQPGLQDAWPMPVLRAKPNKFEKRLAHFKGLVLYGGQGKSLTCDAVYILPLQRFRNHPKMEWFALDTEGAAADDGTILVPDIVRESEGERREMGGLQALQTAKALFGDLGKMASNADNKGGGGKTTFGAFVRIQKTVLLDIPKAALFDLPKELVTDAKAAIENLNHPELFAEPNPPGAHAMIQVQGRLQMVNFGARLTGPPHPEKEKDRKGEKDKADEAEAIVPIFILPDVTPHDFAGEFTGRVAEVVEEKRLEEDGIAKAFSEYEQSVATLRAQIQVAQRLSAAMPRSDYKDAFVDSVADLKRLIQRCNLLLLRFPHDAFGGKGKDLMELFEVLQLQAQGLLQAAEAEEDKEEEEPELPVTHSNGQLEHGKGDTAKGKWFKKKSRNHSVDEAPSSHQRQPSSSAPPPAPAPALAPAPPPAPIPQQSAPPLTSSATVAPSSATVPPAGPGGRPAIDVTGLPKEIKQFVELVDSVESQLTCVETYSAAVAKGQVEFKATLQEETELLLTFLKGAQEKVNDVPANIYSTDAGKAQAQQAESVVNHYYLQVARAENIVGADVIRGLQGPQKAKADKPWLTPGAGSTQPTPAPRTAAAAAASASSSAASSSSPAAAAKPPPVVPPLAGRPTTLPLTSNALSSARSSTVEESPLASTASNHSLQDTPRGMTLPHLDRSAHAVEWRARFKLPPDESLLNDFACAFKSSFVAVHQGRMYVSKNHICFWSPVGHVSHVIEFLDIANIQKKASTGLIGHSIEISLRRTKKLLFTNFVSRDTAHQLIFALWQSALLMAPA